MYEQYICKCIYVSVQQIKFTTDSWLLKQSKISFPQEGPIHKLLEGHAISGCGKHIQLRIPKRRHDQRPLPKTKDFAILIPLFHYIPKNYPLQGQYTSNVWEIVLYTLPVLGRVFTPVLNGFEFYFLKYHFLKLWCMQFSTLYINLLHVDLSVKISRVYDRFFNTFHCLFNCCNDFLKLVSSNMNSRKNKCRIVT